jgi:glycosyltransferase involved in cell wall biosynthesis
MTPQPPPKVSVIVPAYNQAHFLEKALESLLAQTFRDYEIIVVDDGSTDRTPEIAAHFQERIRYIRQENKGLAGARNTGIVAAQGEWIGLLDSDDEWKPNYLETMVALADENPDGVVFYCLAQSVDVDGNPLPQIVGGPVQTPDELYPAMVRANFIIPSTVLMKTEAIKKAGLFDGALRSCEDWDLWLRLLPEQKFLGLNDCLVRYRIHGSSLSTDPSGMQRAARMVIEKHFGKEDGPLRAWSDLKKRAFGGLYSYYAWTTILRQGDWEVGGEYLQKALTIDEELWENLDLFYEILLGRQPMGYRGTHQFLDLGFNVENLEKILREMSAKAPFHNHPSIMARITGTAFFAAGLLAYNCKMMSLARRYLFLALKNRKNFILEIRFIRTFFRSLLPSRMVIYLKRVKTMLTKI